MKPIILPCKIVPTDGVKVRVTLSGCVAFDVTEQGETATVITRRANVVKLHQRLGTYLRETKRGPA